MTIKDAESNGLLVTMSNAVCIKNCGPIKTGMTVHYEMHESYGNEWVNVSDETKKVMIDISMPSFEAYFVKI